MKKPVLFFAFLISAAAVMTFRICAIEEPQVRSANAALIYCVEADSVMWSKNADAEIYPASTVKMMTAILALEHYRNDMDAQITVLNSEISGITGNNIGLKAGETVTAFQLINAVILSGANDAATVLACEIAGTESKFVKMMNEKASELGAVNTHYTNPTGLHDKRMVTTASDILKIARYCYYLDVYTSICGQARYIFEKTNKSPVRYITNRNYFIYATAVDKYYYNIVNGMNSGMTQQAGYCLVASAQKNGLDYIAVVMGADETRKIITPAETVENEDGTVTEVEEVVDITINSYTDARELIDWAIENYSFRKIVDPSTMICEIPVLLGTSVDHVVLLPVETIEMYLPNDINISEEIELSWTLVSDSLTAPIKSGTEAGTLYIKYHGNLVGQTAIVVKINVERSEWLYLISKVRDMSKTGGFRIGVIIAVISVFCYVFSVAVYRSRRRQEARREFIRRSRGT